jgi:hypothetical protein
VPLISALVILVDELWVKPTEAEHERRRAPDIEVPRDAELAAGRAADGEEETDQTAAAGSAGS